MPHKLQRYLETPLASARGIMDQKIMRRFARTFGLVYFGSISAQNADYELVRGVTLHTYHQDSQFVIGNYKGYDVTFLQRRVTMTHPYHGTATYKWVIGQGDLQRRRLPHLLITVSRDDALFFENIQIKLANFMQLNPSLIPHHDFARHFKVFSATEDLDSLPAILGPDIMEGMVRHFPQFDVELFDDQLIVYTHQSRLQPRILSEMLREVMWLAERLDAGGVQSETDTTKGDE